MAPVIDMRAVVKRFGSTVALDGLDLQVDAGEVHGFLGPNGAGKTTTLRILLGLLRIDAGSVEILGGDPWSDAVELHKRLAYVPGEVNLWPHLTGGEVIDLLGRLHGGLDEQRRARYLEMFELDPTKKARTYSKGNRQKVALVAALALLTASGICHLCGGLLGFGIRHGITPEISILAGADKRADHRPLRP